MSDGATIRVLVADDATIVRETLVSLISAEDDLSVVGAARDAAEAVTLAARHRPDVAIVDLRMPGNGIEAARAIREASPATRVMALSANVAEAGQEPLVAGEDIHVLPKGTGGEAILKAIRDAARRDAPPPTSL